MATDVPCFKVILCGEYGVGKSSIFRRFVDNSFTEDSGPRSTIGLDHMTKEFTVNGRKIKLELWDTAGIERFATLSASYFQSSSAAVLCYSRVDRESFSMLSQHILDIIMHSKTAKIFLCGNKCDLHSDDEITDADVESFSEQCDTVLSGIFTISCKTGHGLTDMFTAIVGTLLINAEQKFDPTRIQPHESPADDISQKHHCCS